jgi:hypothetical protein
MAYYDQALLTQDGDFYLRLGACAEVEQDLEPGLVWASTHQASIAAAPGFADAYASALASGVPNPGRDPAVISDQMILSAVQAELAGT